MRIGIIGAGQLGQMLGFAATALGDECVFVDPGDDPPAAQAGTVVKAAFDDPVALADLAKSCDAVTYEFENVPVDALRRISADVPVAPALDALQQAQDRLAEKRLFESLDIPLPGYRAVDSLDDLRGAADALGLPAVLKTRRFGYDGKGQFVIRGDDDIEAAWDALGGQPLIAEAWVDFDYEVSAIAARGVDGDFVIWPLTRNTHVDGILHTSVAPWEDSDLFERAGEYMRRLLKHLEYVGVLALEMFVRDGDLLANEFAPRVHNSGHWTIEGASTSQFTNHILAVTGRRLQPVDVPAHAGMLNLIGDIPAEVRGISQPDTTLHDYGKAPRPGRKLGHVTVIADSAGDRDRMLEGIV